MRRDRIAVCLVLAALSGCGRAARPAARAKTGEVGRAVAACSLIPAGDAAALLGGAVGPPTVEAKEVAGSGVSQCSYRASGRGGYLTVLARTAATREGAAAADERAGSLATAL